MPTKHEQPITLTPSEREVLRLCAEGLTAKEAAADLSVSVRTIHFHKSQIFGKLNVDTTMRMVIKARELGLL